MLALRILGHLWAAPLSLLGLLAALVTGSRFDRVESGALIFRAGPLARWWMRLGLHWGYGIVGWCLGDTVVLVEAKLHDPCTVAHELRHAWQCRVGGPLQPLAYLVAGVVALAQGGSFYWDNYLEVDARRAARKAEVCR